MNDVLDHLQQATVKLSRSGPIKDRLADAYTTNLANIDASDIPERYRAEFVELHTALNRERPLPRESVVRASVRKMSSEEADRHATLVVHAFAALARLRTPVVARAAAQRKPSKDQVNAIIKVSPIVKLFARDG
ncbi:MAG: hypothetical protein ABI616_14250 [Pseudomonadota bacterium]